MGLLYGWLTRLVRRIAPLLARDGSKLSRGIAGRRSAPGTLAAWGRERRDPQRPVVWLHAPSVGEGLQAKAVAEALRARRPDLQVVFTHFSPSAEGLAARFGAEVAAYLPWDVPEVAGATLGALRPAVLVFTKTEVWPVLAAEARARDVPVALVAASVPDGAGRARWPARVVMRPAWRSLALACASTDADRDRLVALGVDAGVAHTTGDPGIDSAAARSAAADPAAPHLAPFRRDRAPTVVAGSTWPADEAVLLPALRDLRQGAPDLRVVIAPHEPTPPHVAALLERLRGDGWSATTLSDVVSGTAPGPGTAVVVDSVGVLSDLYTVAAVAYVGGGFHDAGLHSVLEPAAAAVPVLFGPRHRNARAAGDLLRTGGAKIAADTREMARALSGWLTDEAGRGSAGGRALAYIDLHRGAAARTAELLEALVPRALP